MLERFNPTTRTPIPTAPADRLPRYIFAFALIISLFALPVLVGVGPGYGAHACAETETDHFSPELHTCTYACTHACTYTNTCTCTSRDSDTRARAEAVHVNGTQRTLTSGLYESILVENGGALTIEDGTVIVNGAFAVNDTSSLSIRNGARVEVHSGSFHFTAETFHLENATLIVSGPDGADMSLDGADGGVGEGATLEILARSSSPLAIVDATLRCDGGDGGDGGEGGAANTDGGDGAVGMNASLHINAPHAPISFTNSVIEAIGGDGGSGGKYATGLSGRGGAGGDGGPSELVIESSGDCTIDADSRLASTGGNGGNGGLGETFGGDGGDRGMGSMSIFSDQTISVGTSSVRSWSGTSGDGGYTANPGGIAGEPGDANDPELYDSEMIIDADGSTIEHSELASADITFSSTTFESEVEIYNTSITDGAPLRTDNTLISIRWTVLVHVVDNSGNDLSGAMVSFSDKSDNGLTVPTKTTDGDGDAEFIVTGRYVDEDNEPQGEQIGYVVKASYHGQSSEMNIYPDENMNVDLSVELLTVTITRPEPGATVGGTTEVGGVATTPAAGGTIQSVRIDIVEVTSGTTVVSNAQADGGEEWVYQWDTEAEDVTDRSNYNITVRASDGTSEATAWVAVYVDQSTINHAPTVTISSPSQHAELSDSPNRESIVIEGTATDRDADDEVCGIQFAILDGNGSEIEPFANLDELRSRNIVGSYDTQWWPSNNTMGWSIAWHSRLDDGEEYPTGDYVLAVRAYDGDLYSTSATVAITLHHLRKPSVTLQQINGDPIPDDGPFELRLREGVDDGEVQIEVRGSDPDGAASTLEYSFDFGDGAKTGWQSDASASHQYEYNRTWDERDGDLDNRLTYTAVVRARDEDALVSNPKRIDIVINYEPKKISEGILTPSLEINLNLPMLNLLLLIVLLALNGAAVLVVVLSSTRAKKAQEAAEAEAAEKLAKKKAEQESMFDETRSGAGEPEPSESYDYDDDYGYDYGADYGDYEGEESYDQYEEGAGEWEDYEYGGERGYEDEEEQYAGYEGEDEGASGYRSMPQPQQQPQQRQPSQQPPRQPQQQRPRQPPQQPPRQPQQQPPRQPQQQAPRRGSPQGATGGPRPPAGGGYGGGPAGGQRPPPPSGGPQGGGAKRCPNCNTPLENDWFICPNCRKMV